MITTFCPASENMPCPPCRRTAPDRRRVCRLLTTARQPCPRPFAERAGGARRWLSFTSPPEENARCARSTSPLSPRPPSPWRRSPPRAQQTTEATAYQEAEDDDMVVQPFNLTVDDLEDMDLKSAAGDDIGEVEEVLTDGTGQPVAVAVEVGGFLGIGEREVVLPLDQLQLDRRRPRHERRPGHDRGPARLGGLSAAAGDGALRRRLVLAWARPSGRRDRGRRLSPHDPDHRFAHRGQLDPGDHRRLSAAARPHAAREAPVAVAQRRRPAPHAQLRAARPRHDVLGPADAADRRATPTSR